MGAHRRRRYGSAARGIPASGVPPGRRRSRRSRPQMYGRVLATGGERGWEERVMAPTKDRGREMGESDGTVSTRRRTSLVSCDGRRLTVVICVGTRFALLKTASQHTVHFTRIGYHVVAGFSGRTCAEQCRTCLLHLACCILATKWLCISYLYISTRRDPQCCTMLRSIRCNGVAETKH